MPLTSGRDKAVFWNRLLGDPYIQKNMALAGADDAACARKIIKQREINEQLKADSRFICIFEAPAQGLAGPFQLTVMEIDVLMAAGGTVKIYAQNRKRGQKVAVQLTAASRSAVRFSRCFMFMYFLLP
ncbi:MAG: hypothetical protein GXY32_06555, partial [Ruminococcaceae bacterium]|nr:hypothetical protein [Oscillospiraceae bacterium]